jgi:hypothetical protein
MQKKLTITVDEQLYEGLHRVIGRGNISQLIEGLVRPHLGTADLAEEYRLLALDEAGEAEALEWIEAMIEDVADESR